MSRQLSSTGRGSTEALVEHVENVVVLEPGDNLSIALFAYEKDGDDLGTQTEGWLSLLSHFYFVSHGEALSPLQGRVLRDIFSDYYRGSTKPLTVLDLVSRLDRVLRREAQNLNGWPESIEAAISRLVPLTVGRVGATFNRSYRSFNVGQLFEPKLTIIDLSVLTTDHALDPLSQVDSEADLRRSQ